MSCLRSSQTRSIWSHVIIEYFSFLQSPGHRGIGHGWNHQVSQKNTSIVNVYIFLCCRHIIKIMTDFQSPRASRSQHERGGLRLPKVHAGTVLLSAPAAVSIDQLDRFDQSRLSSICRYAVMHV